MEQFIFSIKGKIGGRKEQQDFAGSAETNLGLVVVVCDGMGGTNGGAKASTMAVNIILDNILTNQYQSAATALLESFKKANNLIYERAQNDADLKGMGTTVTAIILQNGKATMAYAGDSRIYQLRKTNPLVPTAKKIFRTNDHSRVFEMVQKGVMTEEQARQSPDANIITRYLGVRADVNVEIHSNLTYRKGDRFLLCTDGVSGAIPEMDLLKMIYKNRNVEETAKYIVDTIDQFGIKSGGGHDNLTAAVIECKTGGSKSGDSLLPPKQIIISLSILLIMSIGYIVFHRPDPEVGNTVQQNKTIDSLTTQIHSRDSVIKQQKDTIQNYSSQIGTLLKENQVITLTDLQKHINELKAKNKELDGIINGLKNSQNHLQKNPDTSKKITKDEGKKNEAEQIVKPPDIDQK